MLTKNGMFLLFLFSFFSISTAHSAQLAKPLQTLKKSMTTLHGQLDTFSKKLENLKQKLKTLSASDFDKAQAVVTKHGFLKEQVDPKTQAKFPGLKFPSEPPLPKIIIKKIEVTQQPNDVSCGWRAIYFLEMILEYQKIEGNAALTSHTGKNSEYQIFLKKNKFTDTQPLVYFDNDKDTDAYRLGKYYSDTIALPEAEIEKPLSDVHFFNPEHIPSKTLLFRTGKIEQLHVIACFPGHWILLVYKWTNKMSKPKECTVYQLDSSNGPLRNIDHFNKFIFQRGLLRTEEDYDSWSENLVPQTFLFAAP